MFDRIWWALIGLFVIAVINLYLIVKSTEQQMPQAPQTNQQGPLAKAMPGAAAVADQFQNQAKPFGWLVDMINHITGAAPPQQHPGQPQQQGQQPAQQQPNTKPQSAAQPQQDAVPELASVMQANPNTNQTGPSSAIQMMPQSQGSFGWLLQMMQQQQMREMTAQQQMRPVSPFIPAQPGMPMRSKGQLTMAEKAGVTARQQGQKPGPSGPPNTGHQKEGLVNSLMNILGSVSSQQTAQK